MEVDSLKQTGSVRPGSKRTHTGELATAQTPHSPDPPHNLVESLVSQVFKVAFTVSTNSHHVSSPTPCTNCCVDSCTKALGQGLVTFTKKWYLVSIGMLLYQSDCLKSKASSETASFQVCRSCSFVLVTFRQCCRAYMKIWFGDEGLAGGMTLCYR